MPDICVPLQICSTSLALWLSGQHPTIEDGMVTRPVCANDGNDCCRYKPVSIQVKACSGNYYVYEFKDPQVLGCPVAYCAGNYNYTSLL